VPADEDAALGLFGDSTRRTIFTLLGHGPSSVAELAARMPISRPAVSQHLTLLKSCGLVRSRAEGTRRIYELDRDRAEALVDHLHRVAFPWPPMRQRRPPAETGAGVAGGTVAPLVASAMVHAEQDRSFTTFTAGLGSWWPLGFHLGATEPAGVSIEPWTGGRWYEWTTDGSEHTWGRIMTWGRPRLLVATWEIDGTWRPDPDPSHASEIAVRFRPAGRRRTAVDIGHRGFDRLVGGVDVRQALAVGATWDLLLARFARSAAAGAAPDRPTPGHHASR
jgi:DNA-binding transcriptional ArsR family regulator